MQENVFCSLRVPEMSSPESEEQRKAAALLKVLFLE
jgi:hypothetical protein